MERRNDKKKHTTSSSTPLPVTTSKKFKGEFNGYSIVVTDVEEARVLNRAGTFGKGSLSRNAPTHRSDPQILRNRQFEHRKARFTNKNRPRKVLIVPDSESEPEDYFTSLKVRYEIDLSGACETLNLSPEEAYFLAEEVECLDIYDEERLLTPPDAWKVFVDTDEYFVRNYVVYRYYRSRNWVVKPGIKFGGDFVLYKGSPQEFHASYVVVIDMLDGHGKRNSRLNRNDMKTKHLYGLNRVAETAGKELLICQIVCPEGLQLIEPADIAKVTVNEVVMKRWSADTTNEN